MKQNRLSRLTVGNLRRIPGRILAASLGVAAVVWLYLGNLGRLSPLMPVETAGQGGLAGWLVNPLHTPYDALDSLMHALPFFSAAAKERLAAAFIALACSAIFVILARRWHGWRNGLIAGALFVCSTWMLQTGRLGSGLILITFMVLSLIALAAWLSNSEGDGRLLAVAGLVAAMAFTTPGGIWFAVATGLIIRQPLAEHWRAASTVPRLLAVVLPVAALGIVARAALADASIAAQWAGLPAIMPDWLSAGKQLAGSLSYLTVRGPFLPEIWLAHTPILDAAQTVLLGLGVVLYVRRRHNSRVKLLLVFAVLGAVMIGLHGAAAMAYLVPVVYLVVATGVAYLLHHWTSVFPRNPIARATGIGLVAALTVASVSFHTERYFVAWRNSPDTRNVYDSQDSSLQQSNLIQ